MRKFLVVLVVALFAGATVAYAAATKHAVKKTAAAPAGQLLLGDTVLEATADGNGAGNAQAWVYAAATTGTTTDVEVYVTSGSAASKLTVGLYSTSSSKPSKLLASGSATGLVKNAWNDITIASTPVTAGTKYAVAVLSVGGAAGFLDNAAGACNTWTSTSSSLTSLPASWKTGDTFSGFCPASVYVNGATSSSTSSSSTTSSGQVTNLTPPSIS